MMIVRQERGGINDGNPVCAHIPIFDGLGPCGDNVHCSERHADGSKDQKYVERDTSQPKTGADAWSTPVRV